MPDLHARPEHFMQKSDPGLANISSIRNSLEILAIVYTLFVIYGSLVPLDFKYHAWQEALETFKNIRYLKLGIGSRADWVTNILLYAPLAFLWLGTLCYAKSVVWRIVAALFVLLACTGLNIAIEFTQIFFPPRTVSLNDIIAEFIGTVLGIALWTAIGTRLVKLIRAIFQGGIAARHAVLVAYALSYATLSLFPFDFLISHGEWQAHLASNKAGWLFAQSCSGRCVWNLIPEMIATAPLGILGILALNRIRRMPLLLAAIGGILLGLLIEGLQLTIASGISQGASIGSRAAGVMLGVWLAQSTLGVDWFRLRRFVRVVLVIGSLPYLAMLAWLNHWFVDRWLGIAEGLARLGNLHFLPFYYHYYSSESVAMVSLLFQAGLYLPIGAGVWLWRWGRQPEKPELSFVWPAITAAILACVIEAGKFFIPSQHPDPTNILIAATSAVTAHKLLQLLFASTSNPA